MPILLCGCVDLESQVPNWVSTWCAEPTTATVACVLDGDTFDVESCGDDLESRIRLLGIQAPEIAHDEPAECYGDEAHTYLNDLIQGRQVRLEFDVECTGLYGRTLAWASLEGDETDPLYDELLELDNLGIADDGTFDVLLNELLVRGGYARLYNEAIAGTARYETRLEAAEIAAASEQRGLWHTCDDR